MAVRVVVDRYVIRLDLNQKTFQQPIPLHFIDREPDRERLVDLWQNFADGLNKIFRNRRRAALSNGHMRKTVFESAMENICKDFSRRTVNIKVGFAKLSTEAKKKKQYVLNLTKLSDIPDNCRHVHESFVAEIPPREQEADAELVGSSGQAVVLPTHGGAIIPTEQIEILDDHSTLFDECGRRRTDLPVCIENFNANPPVAQCVLAGE